MIFIFTKKLDNRGSNPKRSSNAPQLGLEPERIQIVFNRFKSGTAPVDIGKDIPIAIIPDNLHIEAADLAATPVSQIPFDSPARVAVLNLAKKIQKHAHEKDEKPE